MSAFHSRRWHASSVFGDGPHAPLDRNARARFAFLLHAHHRARRLTRAARDVGRALLRRLGVDGRCDPSHATLAEDAACSERTVRRACEAMRGLGLLRWTRRLVRNGPYVEQTSNGYTLTPASAAVPSIAASARIGGGQKDHGTGFIEILEAFPSAATEAAQAALARRRVAFAAQLALKGRQPAVGKFHLA